MKQFVKRLKSRSGETLIESLAAILIFTFASIGMLFMITSAMNINKMVEEADEKYYKDMRAVEMAGLDENASVEQVDVSFSIGGITKDSVKVTVYGGEDLYAYYAVTAKTEQGGGES